MSVWVLGPLLTDGGPLSPRERSVLSALVLRVGFPVTPDELADAVWGEEPPGTWPKQIQASIGLVRRSLGARSIATGAGSYTITLDPDSVDARRFDRLVDAARSHAIDGDPARAADALDRALDLWRGAPYPDLPAWPPAVVESERLTEVRVEAEELRLGARLALGEHDSAIAGAERLVREQPLREQRWALLATALYRSGRQADALAAIRTARERLADELGVEPGEDLRRLELAILRHDSDLELGEPPATPSDVCPYRGLTPFGVDDEDDFFGRDDDIDAALGRLARSTFLAVTGASGSGKSSLVRAGLVPVLRRRGDRVVILTPSSGLGTAMRDAISANRRAQVVVVVDQFEELFHAGVAPTEVDDAGLAVSDAIEHGVSVILVVRSDFLDECAAQPGLGGLFSEGVHLVGPMSPASLRDAIEQPARRAGLRLEPGLTELILRDAAGGSGSLPHVSHALVETWLRREGGTLTVAGYEESGGISSAIAQSADRLYQSLDASQRALCRSTLARLVELAPDGSPVRRRVQSRALRADAARDEVLSLLADARLVSTEADSVVIAHESLATAWPRLHAWLEEDTESSRVLTTLSNTAEAWEVDGRPEEDLYRGARLQAVREWRDAAPRDLTGTEVEFLDASAEREFADEQRAAERARRERRQNRLRRILLVSAVTLVVGSITATVLAVRGAEDSARQRETAHIERLVGTSLSLRSSQRAVAALLSVEARTRWPDDPRTRAALMGTFTAAPTLIGAATVASTEKFAVHPIPGTDEAVVARYDGTAGVYEIETARLRRELELAPSTAVSAFRPAIAVSADAGTAVVVRQLDSDRSIQELETSELIAVDLASGDAIAPPRKLSIDPAQVAVDRTGSSAAVAGQDGRIRVVDLTSMRVSAVRYPWAAGEAAVAFLDDGRLVIGSGDAMGIVDLATMDGDSRFALPPGFAIRLVAQVGSVLVTAGDSGILAMEAASGAIIWRQDSDRRGSECSSLTVSTARGAAWCSTEAGHVVEYDVATGLSGTLFLQPGSGVFPSADGTELVIAGSEKPVLSRWGLDGQGAITRVIARDSTGFGGYSPDGSSILVADRSGRVHVWDPLADSSRLVLPADTLDAAWAGIDVLLVHPADRDLPALLDATTGDLLPSDNMPPYASPEWSWTTGRRVQIAGETDLWVLDPATGEILSGPFDLDGGWATSVSSLPDGSRMLVTSSIDGVYTTRMLDVEGGEFLSPELVGPEIVTLVGDAFVVGADGSSLLTYAIDDFAVTGSLPSTAAGTRSLQPSTDGGTLLATGTDGSASLFDIPSGLRLGDPIQSAAGNAFAASLRPDGRELAVALSDGVQLWDLDPEAQVEAACRIAGRDLTREEWEEHLGEIGPYRSTCGYGLGGE